MNRLARSLQLPLLKKELSELAARRQTYAIRLGYAAILFMVACVLFYGNLSSSGSGSVLGRGRSMFVQLVELQFWGIYLLLPAMVCGVISSEKERDSLCLLMLSTLSPIQIIVQKLLSRLIPMFSFLFISFPLMAIAFSNGGVTSGHLWAGIIFLVLTCIQVGSFSVACSAFFRTTNESFVASYLGILVMSYVLPGLFAPDVFVQADSFTPRETFEFSILSICATGCFLMCARVFLVTRAAVPARNYLLELFQALDGIFTEMNQVTGGIVLTQDTHKLPLSQPVAWRETSKKSLGTVRYLFRILVVLEIPLLCTFQLISGPGYSATTTSVTTLLYLLWGISVVMVSVHAASLVSSERSRQTLDVLLTTPISGRNIIQQKIRGVSRLIYTLFVPFLSIFAFEQWYESDRNWEYFCWSTVCVAIYLPLTAWFSMWWGLRTRTQARATGAALCLIVAWVVIPLAVRYLLNDGLSMQYPRWWEYLFALSPAYLIRAVESGDPYWHVYSINVGLHIILTLSFRYLSFRGADQRLGRARRKNTTVPATAHPA